MELKDILLSMVTKQTCDGEIPETYEITTEGILKKTPEGICIEYCEPDEELGNSQSSILINTPEHITMTRSGDYNARLDIEKGVRHNCIYETPYGSLMMGVFAKETEAVFDEYGGKIKMNYTIDINSEFLSENEIDISVKFLN